jgi:aminopeptidase
MAIENFDTKLKKYAELIVKVGLNVQVGQKVVVRAGHNTVALVREITAAAYKAGSPLVTVVWSDEQLSKIRQQYAPRDSFDRAPAWMYEGIAQEIKEGAAYLQVAGADPELFKGMDPETVKTARQTLAKNYRPIGELQGQSATQWNLVCPPTPDWAKRVFPDISVEDAEEKLWETVFRLCRLDNDDPVATWEAHLADLKLRREYLSEKQYAALHFRAPGTDLNVGLPKNHIWMGGGSQSADKTDYVANIPTEEVFTLPHKDMVNGTVASTKPLSYYGSMIENFSLTFKDGKVIELSAENGENVLREMVSTDEGASFLGEVALVTHGSPISQSDITFLNTLYDENASCHLALGRAYKFNLEGGPEMSNDEFFAAGGNNSNIHVDFMFGSGKMDIDGITADGSTEPIIRGGEWAFNV